MQFNEHQNKLWRNMLKAIKDFREGKIQYSDAVSRLIGSLDAGEFKDENLIRNWYDYWTPLEILNSTKGNNTKIEDADTYLSYMEMFLNGHPDFCKKVDE